MPSLLDLALVAPIAFVAATLAAVSGFGGAAVLLPVLVVVFGVRDAVPILTLAQLAGNGSRVWFNRREVDWRVVGWFALGGVPLALAGGYLFATAPLAVLTRVLGGFLLVIVVVRHVRERQPRRFSARWFVAIGAGSSFLSALLGSVGPVMAPFFLAYGLVKGAYIGTEAMSTVVMHVTKLVAYGETAVLSSQALVIGGILAPVMVAGSYAGKRIVERLPERVFVWIIEIVLVAAGLLFLVRG